MFDNNEDLLPSCSSPEDIVAYLYDEMDGGGRERFELHLADCEACSSELAELSFARLDVYEWHRDEFVPMETPRIAVPYAQAAKASWLDGVRAWFAAPGRLVAAGGAFGLIAVAILGTYLAFRPAPGDLARESVPVPTGVERNLPAVTPAPNDQPENRVKRPADDEPEKEQPEQVRPVRISAPERKPSAVRGPAAAKRKPAVERPLQTRTAAPGPRLNDFDEEEDNTLRLGDLLAEIDARD